MNNFQLAIQENEEDHRDGVEALIADCVPEEGRMADHVIENSDSGASENFKKWIYRHGHAGGGDVRSGRTWRHIHRPQESPGGGSGPTNQATVQLKTVACYARGS